MSQNETSKLVGRRLKSYREARGMSAEQVADELSAAIGKDVQPYIINRMEKGSRPISVDEVAALAEILSVRQIEHLFLVEDRESNMRVHVRRWNSVTYAAYLQAVDRVGEFLRQRRDLSALIRFAESEDVKLSGSERNDYSHIDADSIWRMAESKLEAMPNYADKDDEGPGRWGRIFDGSAS